MPLYSEFQNKNTLTQVGDFVHTSMVSHRGTVVSFAMNAAGRIKYAVLDLSEEAGEKILDKDYWSVNPRRDLKFPNEISQTGYALVGNYRMPLRGEQNKALTEEEKNDQNNIDPFFSSTAKLSAIAPFQVLSDGKYIYLFRQARAQGDPLVDTVHVSKDDGTEVEQEIVNGTLLVDRFILSGTDLVLSREIRYQRSRHKTEPASRKDTLAAKDVDGTPFYEATKELSFVRELANGGFAVLLIPTGETEVKRWQLFYYDTQSQKLNSVSIRMSADGWFDTTDSEAFVHDFMESRELGQLFTIRVLTKMRSGKSDLEVAELIKAMPEFTDKLSGLTKREIEEVVFALRTGIVKDDFGLQGYSVETGLSAIFYYQQETDPVSRKPMKNNANVMLAMGLQAAGDTKCYLGVLNFAVAADGRLSRLSAENLQLEELDMATIDQAALLEEIKLLEESDIPGLNSTIQEKREEIVSNISDLMFWETDSSIPARSIPNNLKPRLVRNCRRLTSSIGEVEEAIINSNDRIAGYQTAIDALDQAYNDLQSAAAQVSQDFNGSETQTVLGEDYTLEYDKKITTENKGKYYIINKATGTAWRLSPGNNYRISAQPKNEGGPLFLWERKTDANLIRPTIDHMTGLITDVSERDEASDYLKGLSVELLYNSHTDKYAGNNNDYNTPIFSGSDLHNGNNKQLWLLQQGEDEFWYIYCIRINYTSQNGAYPSMVRLDPQGALAPTSWGETLTDSYRWLVEEYQITTIEEGLIWDDRQTLQQLIDFEQQTILPFYTWLKGDDTTQGQLTELANKRAQLNAKRLTLKTGIAAQPMPIVEVDRNRLATSGGLLKFAYTADKPFLFDDSMGRISLYFRGENNNFFSAYFNPNIRRSTISDPVEQSELSFKPRLMIGMKIKIDRTISGNSCDLVFEDHDDANTSADKSIEVWAGLPRYNTQRVAGILNGQGNFVMGYLASDYEEDSGEITITCQADNDLYPTSDSFAGLTNINGANRALSEYLIKNPLLLLGNKRFRIKDDSLVNIKAGRILKSSISRIVTDETHVEMVWDRLKTKGIIRDDTDDPGLGIFKHNTVFKTGNGLKIRLSLSTQNDIKYTETDLVNLLKQAAFRRRLTFQVDDQNATSVSHLDAGIEIQSVYDYAANYSCTPGNLTSTITFEPWQHPLSFLFQAVAPSAMDMQHFTAKVYTIENSIGQWESYDPGLAVSFDRALEINQGQGGQGKTGLLTTAGKLAVLQPTSQGLTLEAWINPRDIDEDQSSAQIICFKNGTHQYSLGITKDDADATQYRCYGIIGNDRIDSERWLTFGQWKHVAISFKKYWGLVLNQTSLNCSNDRSLSLNEEFAIELLFKTAQRNGTLLQKQGEYQLELVNGKLVFNYGGHNVLAGNALEVEADDFYKVTIIKSKKEPENISAGTINPFPDKTENKKKQIAGIIKGMDGNTTDDAALEKTEALWDILVEGEFISVDGTLIDTVDNLKDKLEIIDNGAYIGKESDLSDILSGSGSWYENLSTDETIKAMAGQQDAMTENSQFAQAGMLGDQGAEDALDEQYYYSLVVGRKKTTGEWHNEAPFSVQRNIDRVERAFSDLLIGSADLNCTIAEVRMWGRALSIGEAGALTISGNKKSLLAHWRMSEGEGKYTYDDAGNNHGVVEDTIKYEWVDSPNPALPKYRFYVDGQEEIPAPSNNPVGLTDQDQFSLGGYQEGSTNVGHFHGTLEEVRVWGLPRSHEEISDNGFGRLKGEKEKLLANFTFDTYLAGVKKEELAAIEGLDSMAVDAIWAELSAEAYISTDGVLTKTEDELQLKLSEITVASGYVDEIEAIIAAPAKIIDRGYNAIALDVDGQLWIGAEGEENIAQVLSTAPLSDEIPAVRSALSGIKTDYHDDISSSPSLVEYGDVQENEDGTLNGILKRCYSFIQNGSWKLVTGYKVGNLVTEWFGQAQFDPQVIGFLEGPPPVPGENFPLSADGSEANIYAYRLNNSVAFEQAEEVSYNYATSKESGYQVSAESEGKFGAGTELLVAPFGFGLSMEIDLGVKAKSKWETGGKRSQSFEQGTKVTTNRTLSAGLAGYDPDPGSETGRYYKLGNTGYALVKSQTADIYLLRLEHNHALVSITWRPNPDIPEDTNIITFPINPLYIKQGTLDGKVGLVADDHYPLALGAYGEYSYFKPREAYQLKDQIEKEKKAIESYYQNFQTANTDDKLKAAIGLTGISQLTSNQPIYGPLLNSILNQSMGQLAVQTSYNEIQLTKKIAEKMSQRNLVNTYVWTVEGGFFAESTQLAETLQEVYNNSFSLALGGSAGATYSFDTSAFAFEQEMLFGSGSSLTLTKTKTKKADRSFDLKVSVELPTSPRYKYSGTDGRTLTDLGIPTGMVDAYRFMSFYLEPKPENYVDLFTKVIDPKWLDESPDPNAVALRQARNDRKKPFCWRIMHRVTFVSRILPEFEPEAPPSLESAMQAKNIRSNYMLIKLFEPYVRHLTNNTAFYNKIDDIIDTQLLEFSEYRNEIKRYLELYFGLY